MGDESLKAHLNAIDNDILIVVVDGQDYELVFSNVDKANLVPKF